MDIGNKIAKLRAERGFTRESFAAAIGVTRQAVYNWESNSHRPNDAYIEKICGLLGVSKSELLSDGELPPVTEEEALCAARYYRELMKLVLKGKCNLRLAFTVGTAILLAVSLFVTVIMGFTTVYPSDDPYAFETVYNYYTPFPVFILMIVVSVALIVGEVLLALSYKRIKREYRRYA